MSTALIRAYRVLQDVGLSGQAPERVAGARNNEVWFAGSHVLRISTLRSTERLAWEAEIGVCLPPAVPHARVVRRGVTEFGEWMVSSRMPGRPLGLCWPDMGQVERRVAIHQLAAALEALHSCGGPVDDDGAPMVPPFLRDAESLECPHQLPAARLLALLDRCRQLRGVDAGLLDSVADVVRDCADAFVGDAPATTLVHGDLHLDNVLWDSQRITAILDFEWSRRSGPDLDLDVLLRFCADPALHIPAGADGSRHRNHEFLSVPAWVCERYPALFSHPRLRDRLRLYALAYDIPNLLTDPPRVAVADLPDTHAYHRMRRVVEGRDHLAWAQV
jgi:hygromycin-B 7''-O-kinase